MASEAKIGLLLGLVIIFVIAFVLNELPRFGEAADSDPPGDSRTEEPLGIGANEREYIGMSGSTAPADTQDESPASEGNSEEPPAYASLPVTPSISPEPPADEDPETSVRESVKEKVSEAHYVVAEGDNLADIAKKFYGPIEGNRRANVRRIFLANRRLLASPHKIRVGQKLVIPRLISSQGNEAAIGSIFPSWMFEKVDSVGMNHLPADNPRPEPRRLYVVREGDNLWHVAAAQLGNALRYKEISRLNAGILKDENTLAVGMRLNLPAQ